MKQTECIILAAGYSSRTKVNKLLLKIGSKTVIECCIDTFYDSCSRIIVVGGHRMEELLPVLMKYKKLLLVYNSHYGEGMFRSVKEGLRYIKGNQFFLTPGDYPMIKKATIVQMLEEEEPVIIPNYNGINGHPVLIKRDLIPEILSGNFESMCDFVMRNDPKYLKVYDIGVISDIDYMEDYYRICRIEAEGGVV